MTFSLFCCDISKQEHLKGMLEDSTINEAYIGLSDVLAEGEYIWVDGVSLAHDDYE